MANAHVKINIPLGVRVPINCAKITHGDVTYTKKTINRKRSNWMPVVKVLPFAVWYWLKNKFSHA